MSGAFDVLMAFRAVGIAMAGACIGFAVGHSFVPKAFKRGYLKGYEVARVRFSNVTGIKQQPRQSPEPPRVPRSRSWP